MRKIAPLFSLLLLLILLLNAASPAFACGPSFVVPVFQFETRPDFEVDAYASGRIGIIQSGYNRTFLLAAYRYFNDAPFTANEQKDLVKVWKSELYNYEDMEADNGAVKAWIAARKKVLPDEPQPQIYTAREWDGGYYFFPNCTANAFETATKTLESRISAHGATNEAVKDWTRAQDLVFGNCSDGKNAPPEADASSPAWLKNDRAYQSAAADFYATKFDEAKARFEKIAANRESVWQATANYLVARTLIRQASLIDDEDLERLKEKRRPIYEQAEAHLQKLMNDASQREYHDAATRLLNLVKYRLRPQERVHELATVLMQTNENANLRQDLIDYRWLLDRQYETAYVTAERVATEEAKKAGKEYATEYNVKASYYPQTVREDDVTDWILTFQSENDEAAYKHSLNKWRETKSRAWFTAAIVKANKKTIEIEQLLIEADATPKNSPAYATVAFHQNRLLMETGKTAEARAKLNFLLTNRMTVFPVSARNAFASQRMMLAENLDEFLQYAQRRATAFAYDGSGNLIQEFKPEDLKDWDTGKTIAEWQSRTMFDNDAVDIFNVRLPLSVLKQAAVHPKLPDYLKRNVVIAAWTKAILLGDEKTAVELAPQLTKLAPEFQTVFALYINAKTPAERQNASTYILLKTPALRPYVEKGYGRLNPIAEIDSYRDNWWCAPTEYTLDGQKAEETIAPTFLTATQVAEAKREREKIKALGNSATYLGKRSVEFATKSPADSRIAESLHLAVRASRYGCTDCNTGTFSKQSHDILKKRFPGSEWAKKTPYWFKDESCETK